MPIERGEDWGWPAPAQADPLWCADDAAVAAAIRKGAELIRIGHGDLARTLGLTSSRDRQPTWHVPIDGLRVRLDESDAVFAAAHVVVGSWRHRSGWCAVLNAAFVGAQNLAPRGHPGDGYAELFTSTVQGRERFMAQQRSRTGTHVPHPQITIKRTRGDTITFDRPRRVSLDGQAAKRVTRLEFEVVPSAIVVAV